MDFELDERGRCPYCTDTPTHRRRDFGAAPHPVRCPDCGALYVPFDAGSEILRGPRPI
jgi:uncharacterized Zn-finger protein